MSQPPPFLFAGELRGKPGIQGDQGDQGDQGPPGPGTGAGAWQPSTAYTANQVVQAPDGSMIYRLADGTSRPAFDSTELALWAAVSSKPGTIEQAAQSTASGEQMEDPDSPLRVASEVAFVRRGPRALNLVQLGGAPDLGVDSTQAVLDALDYADTNPGTILKMPGGPEPYRVTTGNIELPDNLTWTGDGPTSRLIGDYSGYQQAMFKNDWTNGSATLYLADWILDRSGVGTDHGMLVNGVADLLFDGFGVVGAGPRISTVASGAVAISAIGPATRIPSHARIFRFVGRDVNNFGLQLGTMSGGLIEGYDIEGFRELIGLEPESGQVCEGVVIGKGILRGSTVGSGSNTGLLVVTETSGGTVTGWSASGFHVYGDPASSQPGVAVVGPDDGRLSDFLVRGCGTTGIALGNASGGVTNVRLSDGEVLDCVGAAILLRGNVFDNVIERVRVKGASHTVGVDEQLAANRNIVRDCDLRGNTTPHSLIGNASRAYASRTADGGGLTAVTLPTYPNLGFGKDTDAARLGTTGLRVTAKTVTAATAVATLASRYGATNNYAGTVLVIARNNDTNGANTAVYNLLVGKHAAGSSVVEIAKNGVVTGGSASHPSFTWTVNTTDNTLVATPIASTSGAFDFHLQADGDIVLTA